MMQGDRPIKQMLFLAIVAIVYLLPGIIASSDGIGPQITPDIPHPWTSHHLPQDIKDPCSPITPLTVDTTVYNELCSSGSGPCFTLSGPEKVANWEVEPWHMPVNSSDILVLANDDAREFAMRDPTVAFEVQIYSHELENTGVKFRYTDYDPNSNCYTITLLRPRKTKWNLTIGSTIGSDDLDSDDARKISKQFCMPRLYLGVFNFDD